MPFNRIGGFYIGAFSLEESNHMTFEERNSELNQALENRLKQLNAAIDAHEKALKAMMIPRDTSFVYCREDEMDDNGQPSGHWWDSMLGIIKLSGSWRLCHGTFDSRIHWEGVTWKPLVDSSVADRMSAICHLDKLREAVVKEKEQLVPELESALEVAVKGLENYPKASKGRRVVSARVRIERRSKQPPDPMDEGDVGP